MVSEETFEKRLDEIHAHQDFIRDEFPETYFEKTIWKRLDWEAQAICIRAGW